MVLDRARSLDGLDGRSFEHSIRIPSRRDVAEFSSRRARRQRCSCRSGTDHCNRVVSDWRNNFLAASKGSAQAVTRSTNLNFLSSGCARILRIALECLLSMITIDCFSSQCCPFGRTETSLAIFCGPIVRDGMPGLADYRRWCCSLDPVRNDKTQAESRQSLITRGGATTTHS